MEQATVLNGQEAVEAVSEGVNVLYAISSASDFSEAACLSRMRDGLALIRSGVGISYSNFSVELSEEMMAKLDKIIELLGGIEDSALENARDLARSYLAELFTAWGIKLPDLDKK